jgi:signal peptidase I
MLAINALVCYGVTAWVLSWVARKARSPRAKFRFGMLAVLAIVALCVLCIVAVLLVDEAATPIFIALFVIELLGPFFILQAVFRLRFKWALVVYFAFIVVIAVESVWSLCVVKRYLVQAYHMPTPTMAPTIEPTDRFLANKLLQPRRWDVVVYWTHSEGPVPRPYCKRLIGLPGERLRFENGNLYVNDQPVQPPAVLAGKLRAATPGFARGFWKYADGETISLGTDEFFFVGDNISMSLDSRVTGPSDRSTLIGVVDAIYWPLSRFSMLR